MASLTRWTSVWVNSGSWWWTGRPGELQFMGSQRVGHDWVMELNWTDDTYLFLAVLGLRCCTKAFSGCSKQRLFSSCVWASHCGGFSCAAPALSSWTSVIAAHGLSSCIPQALECGLSSCGTKALVACSMWHLSRPRIKPMYPALADRFPSTVPPGK